jgi:hypothetical protein
VSKIDTPEVLRLHAAGNGVMKNANRFSAGGSAVSRETIRLEQERTPPSG